MQRTKPIPIGIEFYKTMIEEGYYYVDKTLLIRDLLFQKSSVILFTRPRRFGKTLAQSMLQTFFEKEIMPDGKEIDNSKYFKGKKIMEAGEEYICQMGKYPVIFLSLKSAKQSDYDMAKQSLIYEVIKEFERHRYVLDGEALLPAQKKRYVSLMEKSADDASYAKSIAFLSECLEQYHKQKTIILFDEYDVPLENAYFNSFYDKMLSFLRSLFEAALKTNKSLKFAVVTGCLRISRESIFTGLNNLEVVSVLDERYAEHFGFTQQEVDNILNFYNIYDRRKEVKSWYNGYLFGNTEVYNPWSLVNYVKDIINKNTDYPKPYWSNTSSNSIVKEMIENADNNVRSELESLAEGGVIEKPVHEDITYEDIYKSQDNLWNFLFFTGYLKAVSRRFENRRIYLTMKIPNEEIIYIYENAVIEWSERNLEGQNMSELIIAIENSDCDKISDFITEQLMNTISFYDYREDYYHGFVTGLLKHGNKYIINSNRESGLGRYDLVMKSLQIRNGRAVILEFKVVNDINDMEKGCLMALEQIEKMHYDKEIKKEGYTDIIKYGVCFYKKECLVMAEE